MDASERHGRAHMDMSSGLGRGSDGDDIDDNYNGVDDCDTCGLNYAVTALSSTATDPSQGGDLLYIEETTTDASVIIINCAWWGKSVSVIAMLLANSLMQTPRLWFG